MRRAWRPPWKNQTTRYILPCHWLCEWFSEFHRCVTYSVLSQSHSVAEMIKTHFELMQLLLCLQWQKGICQQLLSYPIPISLLLMAIFPGQLGHLLPSVFIQHIIGDKDDGSGGDRWSYKACKAPVKYVTINKTTPFFYRPDALPVIRPTTSEHSNDKVR